MRRYLVGNLHVCEAKACGLILGPHEQIYEARRLYSPPHLKAQEIVRLGNRTRKGELQDCACLVTLLHWDLIELLISLDSLAHSSYDQVCSC